MKKAFTTLDDYRLQNTFFTLLIKILYVTFMPTYVEKDLTSKRLKIDAGGLDGSSRGVQRRSVDELAF